MSIILMLIRAVTVMPQLKNETEIMDVLEGKLRLLVNNDQDNLP